MQRGEIEHTQSSSRDDRWETFSSSWTKLEVKSRVRNLSCWGKGRLLGVRPQKLEENQIHVVLQTFNLLDTIVTEVQLLEVPKPLEILNLSDPIWLYR